MIKKLVPLLLILIGVGAGVGAGLTLKPSPDEMMMASNPCGDMEHMAEKSHDDHSNDDEMVAEDTQEYVKLNNQFVVPVVANQLVESLVVMSLSVEISTGQTETIYAREPKLRDAFLQVLFDHANIGGFKGAFTNANNMEVLRVALTEVAQGIIGSAVTGVLITEIARQDV